LTRANIAGCAHDGLEQTIYALDGVTTFTAARHS